MEEAVKKALLKAVESEPFARAMNLEIKEISDGYAAVEMVFDEKSMSNIYGMAHGGAIFALIDEAFELAGNSHGTVAVALNMNITYIASPEPGSRLRAEAKEMSLTRRTATYDIRVHDQDGRLMAACQALVYRKTDRIPFLEP